MNNFTDIQIATDILAMKLSKDMFKPGILQLLLKEKKLVSTGDKKTIEKVINIYGKELKEDFKNGKK